MTVEDLDEDAREYFEERAGIMEYEAPDVYSSRDMAELEALSEVFGRERMSRG